MGKEKNYEEKKTGRCLTISNSLWEQVEATAKENGVSKSSVINDAIANFFRYNLNELSMSVISEYADEMGISPSRATNELISAGINYKYFF